MFDEVLLTYFRDSFTDEELTHEYSEISKKLRDLFTKNLNSELAYEFVLIHHENNRVIDYTSILGNEYKKIIHINSKNRVSLQEEDISTQPLAFLGVVYPKSFNDINEVNAYIPTALSYGVIIKRVTETGIKLYKISSDNVNHFEETNPCNPSVWNNILMVYMKNKKEYHIRDYITQYVPNIELPIDNNNRPIDATYLIHTSISCVKDVIYNLYIATTKYYAKYNRFKMDKDLDNQFPPIIRYHLAQLRHKQLNIYKNKIISPHEVYHYLCQCNNCKNIKALVNFLSTNTGYEVPERSALCLTVLDSLLL